MNSDELKRVEKVIDAFKKGGIVVVFDDEKRENEADLIMAAECADEKAIDFIITRGKGLLCCAISKEIADSKGFSLMGTNKKDPHSTAFTISVDSCLCKTGISPLERALTSRKIADKNTVFKDFITPGHLFPIIAREKLLMERHGHTEAAVALTRWAGLQEAALICELVGKNGAMCDKDEAFLFSQEHNLPYCTIKEMITYTLLHTQSVKKESSAKLKTEYGEFDISIYKDLTNGREHVFLSQGDYTKGILRIHSECFTGDIFHSKSCDCRDQLDEALSIIQKEGKGAIVYLRQEGRGIGLGEKIKAYNLQQNENLDTVEANIKLGFDDDERDYHQAAWILKDKRYEGQTINLLTGNPNKMNCLKMHGFTVKQVIPHYTMREENKKYLSTKKNKMGHTIGGYNENN